MEAEMVTEETERAEKLKTSRDIYLDLTGLTTFPEAPNDLPSKLSLPSEITTPLEPLVLSSLESRKERSQLILWNEKEQRYEFDKEFIGGSSDTGFLDALNRLMKTTRSSNNRPVVDFHTHPEDRLSLFSAHDIALAKEAKSGAYIQLVASKMGIYALLATERSRSRSRIPFPINAITVPVEIMRSRRKLHRKDYSTLGVVNDVVPLIEEQGFGLYVWNAPSRFIFLKGDMANGIELKRVNKLM